jgi:hypothetical protein
MARPLAFAAGLAAAVSLVSTAGCSSTSAGDGAADGSGPCPDALPQPGGACGAAGLECGYATSTNACGAANCYCQGGAWNCEPACAIGPATSCTDASVKLIKAADYDQSCTVATDCRLIAEGNACAPCAFDCSVGAAINVSALAQYKSDVANTPAVAAEFNGQTCASGCPAAFGPCCVGGKCQASTTSQCPAPAADGGDAAADTGADADASACTVDSSEIACCCDGDVGGNGPFCSGGTLSCATGFGLYFGADCTRECGPCAIACPDSGTSRAGADGGGDASHD